MSLRGSSAWLSACLRAVGPRHLQAARIWVTIVVAVPTATFMGGALFSPHGPNLVEIISGLVLAAVCTALIVLPAHRTAALCVAGPFIGSVAIVVLDLGTQDAGLTGQIFFCVPVLYAGIHLRVPGVVLITASAVVGEAIAVLALLPLDEALLDLTYMGAALTLMASVLARASVTQDRLVEQLRRQAAIDPLTGLVTRRVLEDATECAVLAAGSEAGTALVLIDVDRFKIINDTFGHAVGDDALAHLAAILTRQSRGHDVVARMGGDELAVLMPGCGYDIASRRAQELVDAVRDNPLILPTGATVALSISAGTSHAPGLASGPQDLYATADAALYVAKRGGRGRVGLAPAPLAVAATD